MVHKNGVSATAIGCAVLWMVRTGMAVYSSPRMLVADLIPTGLLKNSNDYNDDNDSVDDAWQSAVYAGIPETTDAQDFHRHRHLSRHEQHFRRKHQLDLHLDWDGQYEGQYDEIVNGSIYFRRLSNRNNNNNNDMNNNNNNNNNNNHHHENYPNDHDNNNNNHHAGGPADNYHAVPLSQGYGTHYANLWIGTPRPQRMTLIVDTGSHYTAFPCVGCQNCGADHHTDPYFDPAQSATFHQLQCDECQDGILCHEGRCRFQQAYTEGSTWEANQVRDRVFVGGSHVLDAADPHHQDYAIDFMFGCQTSMTGLFVTQLADGIIGMSAHPATLPKQLYDRGKLEHNLFALCYRRELGTSKRGVHAGSMTLGGVSTALDTTPLVYAQNVARYGWYTVHVKNIYIRSGGGPSAAYQAKTVRVNVNVGALNSGKGVIVDSGTTDTYLNQAVAKEFNKAWKKVTGTAYSHNPISLTPEQLRRLPTILIQCQSASSGGDPAIDNYDDIPGYAGRLDPSSPHDLLIAVPATSYMDYSPITRRYMSRLYFTESVGSVLGSNTMQGHNVVFDWENGRVGFAESSCAYDQKDVPLPATQGSYPTDCRTSPPVLSQRCAASVQQDLCRDHPTNIALLGTERWTSVVESPGTSIGRTCQEATTTNNNNNNQHPQSLEEPVVNCTGTGLCHEERPCQLTCAALADAVTVVELPEWKQSQYRCGDTGWGACDVHCAQARLVSRAYSDGQCTQVRQDQRPCHTGACLRADTCRVPYLVHAVLGFSNTNGDWPNDAEILRQGLVGAVQNLHHQDDLFQAGDIHVVTVLPWYTNDVVSLEDQSQQKKKHRVQGFRVVVEVSMVGGDVNETAQSRKSSPWWHVWGSSKDGNNDNNNNDSFFPERCHPRVLYPLAKKALLVKNLFLRDDFMSVLAQTMRVPGAMSDDDSDNPFIVWARHHHESLQDDDDDDAMVLAWTIRTDPTDDTINYFGPQKPIMATLYTILHGATLLSTLVLVVLSLWSLVCSIVDYYYQHHQQQGHPVYAAISSNDDDDDFYTEDQALRGRVPEPPGHRQFQFLKKRYRPQA